MAEFGNPAYGTNSGMAQSRSMPSYPQGWQPIMPSAPGGRFRQGLRLVGIGFTMARDEPGLMMVPAVAFVIQLLICGLGFLILWPSLHSINSTDGRSAPASAGQWLVAIVVGVLVMFVS